MMPFRLNRKEFGEVLEISPDPGAVERHRTSVMSRIENPLNISSFYDIKI